MDKSGHDGPGNSSPRKQSLPSKEDKDSSKKAECFAHAVDEHPMIFHPAMQDSTLMEVC